VFDVGFFLIATDGHPANSVVVLVLSANDLILGIRGGGVPGLDCCFGGPIGFLALPVTEGNLSPYFNPLVVEVASVEGGDFSLASLALGFGANPGGKNESTLSVLMLSNKEDISNLKSELEAGVFSIFGFESSVSSFSGLKPGGRNALISWKSI
jgi:hypothetical protein